MKKYNIKIVSNVYLEDDGYLYSIAEKDSDGKFYDENIVEMKEIPYGYNDENTATTIILKEMDADEALAYLSNLIDNWCRVSIEY
jgi:hypothetical protein